MKGVDFSIQRSSGREDTILKNNDEKNELIHATPYIF